MSWRRFFHRAGRDAESARDIQFYLDTETDDNILRGMTPEGARDAARRKFGNCALMREEIYRMNSIDLLETFWRDVTGAWRTIRKHPAFALTAVFTLALGIGANTAIFTVIRTLLLKPLEYSDPDQLLRLSMDVPERNIEDSPVSLVRVQEMKAAARSFSAVGAYLHSPENVILSGGEPEALKAARVSANFLEVLRVQPVLGRSFMPEEDVPGGPAVAMISEALWMRRFSGDPALGGRTVVIDTAPHTIVGVLPAEFDFPFPGVDVWVPRPSEWSRLSPRYPRDKITIIIGIGRLKPDVTLEMARAELDVLNSQYVSAHPEANDVKPGVKLRVTRMGDSLVANVRPMLWILFGAVGLVLLIACANVASLLLARASSRSREFAVRSALGAGRARLMGQLLAESLLLSAVGGAVGVLVAWWSLRAITRSTALSLPRSGEIHLDATVLFFTAAISVATGVLFGLVPSLRASRPDLINELRERGATGSSTSHGGVRLHARGILVTGQIALSVVLIIGASLLMRSFARLLSVDRGFRSEQVLTAKIALPPVRYDTDRKRAEFFNQLVSRLEPAPGVVNAAALLSIPFTPLIRTNIKVEGRPPASEAEVEHAQLQSITPGYFRTFGVALRRGREFSARDNAAGAPPVAIINERFARRHWPAYPAGPDPIGQRLWEGADKAAGWMEIVGIVADVHERGLAIDAEPEFYVPCMVHPPQTGFIALRSSGDPRGLAKLVRTEVLAIDADQPASDIRTMDEVIDSSLGQRRVTMLLLVSFAGVALVLAVIGIYGVIAYSVAQRTQEVGIRRALGAQQGDILRLVLREGLGMSLAGVILGVLAALGVTRVMERLLFRVSTTDPLTFTGISVLFVMVALAACLVPAWRASRIDPMKALRIG